VAKVRVGGVNSLNLEEFVKSFAAGATIFREGDVGCEMFIIQKGQVLISHRVGSGEKELAVLEKGDFFGEMALVEEYPERSATVRAVTDVEVLELRSSDLVSLLRRRPNVALRMMAKLSERLREANRRLEELTGRTAEAAALPPSPASQGLVAGAVLIHDETRRLFAVNPQGETAIGRHDPVTGVTPDIDLSSLDPERTVSRKHAVIRSDEGALTVTEVNASTNGTFRNGVRLETFQTHPLGDGDVLQLALVPLRVHIVPSPE
jgi:CRP-like cAMP-binding protein